jgi:hypothetical protein
MSGVMSTHCDRMQSCLFPQSASDEQVRGPDDWDVVEVWVWVAEGAVVTGVSVFLGSCAQASVLTTRAAHRNIPFFIDVLFRL